MVLGNLVVAAVAGLGALREKGLLTNGLIVSQTWLPPEHMVEALRGRKPRH